MSKIKQALAVFCLTPFTSLALVGGTRAQSLYHQLSLQERAGEHHCGATVLSAHWALSAAHCVRGRASFSPGATIHLSAGRNLTAPQWQTPARLRQVHFAPEGQDLALGHGCQNLFEVQGELAQASVFASAQKGFLVFPSNPWDGSLVSFCPGDSGSGMFGLGPTGPVLAGVVSRIALNLPQQHGRSLAVDLSPASIRQWIQRLVNAQSRKKRAPL